MPPLTRSLLPSNKEFDYFRSNAKVEKIGKDKRIQTQRQTDEWSVKLNITLSVVKINFRTISFLGILFVYIATFNSTDNNVLFVSTYV